MARREMTDDFGGGLPDLLEADRRRLEHHRFMKTRPSGYGGTPEEALWEVMKYIGKAALEDDLDGVTDCAVSASQYLSGLIMELRKAQRLRERR